MYYIRLLFSSRIFKILSLVSSGLFLAISFLSYNSYDGSLNVVSNSEPNNMGGLIGAYISDITFQFIGIASWIIPVSFIILATNIALKPEIKNIKLRMISSIFASFLCGFLLFSLFKVSPVGFYKYFNNQLNHIDINIKYGILITTAIKAIIFLSYGSALGIGFYSSISFYGRLILLKIIRLIKNLKASSTNIKKPSSSQKPSLPRSLKTSTSETHEIQSESSFFKQPSSVSDNFIMPPLDLLDLDAGKKVSKETESELQKKAEELLNVLKDFGVKGEIIEINQGPVVTMFEFEPAAGTKSSRVVSLSDDIARTMCTVSARIAVIPGRNVLGIELPNKEREFFRLRELLDSSSYNDSKIQLPIVLGKDLAGRPCVADLAKMPHLLVAGTTGSGKSVAINTMIVSLLYKHTPDSCRFIMIDPKMLELSVYDNIPHLLTPVVTDPGKAVVALKWAVKEMENRYRLMSNVGVRNINGYNDRIKASVAKGEVLSRKVQTGFEPDTGKPIYEDIEIDMKELPFIVIIVDEMADLMLVAGKDIESSIQRLAQMARAAGIHLIMATQRPSVDVITGVIKANFPSRISFKVTSKIDSRTILGEQGSEQLLGMGDMLYMGASSGITRVHGPFVDDSEVERISMHLKNQGSPEYVTSVTVSDDESDSSNNAALLDIDDTSDEGLYQKALQIVRKERKSSTSYIQRSLRIGYNRAALLVERMEKEGILSEPNSTGKREILIDEE
jgi:DNA segregation ATPase FtsK/SpoIIIE, S-DNA-T family